MAPSLIQPLLQFMLWFAVGAAIAMTCCGFTRLLNTDIPRCASFIGFASLFSLGEFVLIPLLLTALFCIPAAFAQKELSKNRTSAFAHYLDLLTANLLGISIGAAFLLTLSHLGRWGFLLGLFAKGWGLPIWAFILGLVTTPSALPIFRWIWRSSKTRPGVDRHLNSSDEIVQP